MVPDIIDIDQMNEIRAKINELYETYKKTYDRSTGYQIYNLILENINLLNDKELLYLKDKGNKTIFEHYISSEEFSEPQLDKFILKHDDLLFEAIKKGKISVLDDAKEFVYHKKIDGITILEYLIKHNMVRPYHIFCAGTSKEIIDIVKKYNRMDLLTFAKEEILFSEYEKDKKVIDYLFENNLVNRVGIRNSINTHTEILDYILKYRKTDLIQGLNNNILMQQVNNRTLLEELLDKGIMPNIITVDNKDMIDIILKYKSYTLLSGITPEYLLYIDTNTNKPLLQILLEEDIECNCLRYQLHNDNENIDKLINLIYMSNRLELLSSINEETLLTKYNQNETLLELLLREGYSILITEYKLKESLDFLIRTENYNELQKCSYDLLKMNMPSGKKVYIELLDRKLKIKAKNITDKEIIDAVIEYERYDLIQCFSIKQLLSYVTINETYLDKILEGLKEKKEEELFNELVPYGVSLNEIAKVLITLVKHDMKDYINEITKESLLEVKDNTTLLEELIKEDSFTAINYIIPDKLKKDIDIAIILKIYGFNVDQLNFPNLTQNISYEYLQNELKQFEVYKLNEVQQAKLDELYSVMNDGQTPQAMLDILIASYKRVLATNSPYAIEIDYLINFKKNNPEFRIKEIKETDHYDSQTKSISMSDINIDTLNHELGHLFFHGKENKILPEGFKELIDKERKSTKTQTMLSLYSKKYLIKKKKIEYFVDSIIMRKYEKNITKEQIDNIEEYLKRLKEKKMNLYLSKGYDEQTLNIIFNQMFTVEDFIKQSKKIKREEIVDSILRVRHGPFIAIGDYFDGIYKGKFHDGKITDILGSSNVASAYGHGSKYYGDNYELIFNEMIANYSEIIKSSHPQEGIAELRFFIGNKLVDMIETYYKENILTLNYELEQKQK